MVRNLVFTAGLLVMAASTTSAQDEAQSETPGDAAPDAELDAEARARFEAGEIAYTSGRFEAALADFRQAHALSGRDQLLYNIGLAAERLRRDEEAIEAFQGFLESAPDHPRAAAIRARIELLRGEQRVREQAATNIQAQADVPPSPVGPVVLGISGALLAVGGGVLLAVAIGDRNTIESLPVPEPLPWNQLSSTVDSVPRRSAAGVALLSLGGAAMLGALIWRLAQPSSPDDASITVSLSPGAAHLRGTF